MSHEVSADASYEEEPRLQKQGPTEGAVEGNTSSKRRRRVFSCETCQRLKCKCDYDFNLQSCRRCQTLRITCSRRETVEVGELMTSDVHTHSIQDRLSSTENALREIAAQLKALTSQIELTSRRAADISPSSIECHHTNEPESFGDSLEQVPDPADHAVHAAPIVVLRDLDRRFTGGPRRARVLTNVDLVEAGLLDADTAQDLIQVFFRHRSDKLILTETHKGMSSEFLREMSPFLHSVCCLQAIIYRGDIFGAAVHRKIYEHVRISLGKILLSIPLSLEDIQGVFLMSENVMVGPADTGKEYIDSWMLTGYCIKQAMLSISFSEIVKNIRTDIATPEDQRAIRLWAKISLDHLYWAATTGRPSAIPSTYLKHCELLLSFYMASMQDGMLLAEILLCTILLQKLEGQTNLDSEGQCAEFQAWKQKWNHLLLMPTASMLKIGYCSACLILIIRSLEDLGENLQSTTLLSSISSDKNSAVRITLNEQGTAKDDTRAALRSNASKHAQSIIETFLSMPNSMRDSIASNRCLCLGYSALILTHYDEAQSSISDQHKLNLIIRFEEWLSNAPGTTWAIMFGKLAKQKLMARVNSNNINRRNEEGVFQRPDGRKSLSNRGQGSFPTHSLSQKRTDRAENGEVPNVTYMGEPINMTPSDAASVWSTPAPMRSEFQADFVFPNMEDFFSGGFLDFSGLEQ
ncbi:hypothetical protein B0J13DRAFT_622729 [Dactylonectria estremocensis]|uniref:Zn(2)-C6 fungal-type domain-containing protein n=1 Tax=Dactylonectria estremocensis TaxID=1079267 RepID=A0A9P9ETI2_9HYPO|nr:hypothetical protein B0J13DRAFT_622729 [Dactylonectria estremocensis]